MKRQPKEIIKKIKEKREAEKKNNVTFRLSNELMERFKEKCEKNDISMTSVLEEMIQDFVNN
jgi:hypothetical protein